MEVGRHRGMMAKEHTRVDGTPYKTFKTSKYLGSLLINQNHVFEEIKCRLKAETSCFCSVQILLEIQI